MERKTNTAIETWVKQKGTVASKMITEDIELFCPCIKLLLNWRKPENSSLLRSKNTKEVLNK